MRSFYVQFLGAVRRENRLRLWEIAFQSAPWVGLALTLYYSSRQLKAATAQARASEIQAKASEQMARLSLQQTELTRAQIHASFQPTIDASGEYGMNCALFTIKNIGNGPALNLTAQYIGGVRMPLGNLERAASIRFQFDNYLNQTQRMLGTGRPDIVLPPVQSTPLRLEYLSITGAKCWTNVQFALGGQGPLNPEMEHGMDLPLNASQHFAPKL